MGANHKRAGQPLISRAMLAASMVMAMTAIQTPARADTWAAVGDRGLRADIELLADRGLIAGLVTTWPIPDGQLSTLLQNSRLETEPAYVQAAAQRVIDARLSGQPRGFEPLASLHTTNEPALVRDFGNTARQQADVSAGFDWTGRWLSLHLLAGEQTRYSGHDGRFALDGTEVTALLGNLQVYAGWVDHWYGPGSVSSLILSNNARPFPKIGLMRNNPHAFESKWLSWLGPWQIDTYVGMLDGPRTDRNTIDAGVRATLNPLPGLEMGLTRTTELCGDNHPCEPLSAMFDFNNNNSDQNKVNEEAAFDVRWSHSLGSVVVAPYLQLMNEDTGPFAHSYTSHLYGFRFAGPWGEDGMRWDVATEFADTVPTLNIFSYGKYYTDGSYNNAGYPDGFRYRGRTTGFSLDSNSRLISVLGDLTDLRGWTWRLALHGAAVSTTELAAFQANSGRPNNVLTPQPQHVVIGEFGLDVPWRRVHFDLSVRAQNHRLEPVQSSRYAAEAGIEFRY